MELHLEELTQQHRSGGHQRAMTGQCLQDSQTRSPRNLGNRQP